MEWRVYSPLTPLHPPLTYRSGKERKVFGEAADCAAPGGLSAVSSP